MYIFGGSVETKEELYLFMVLYEENYEMHFLYFVVQLRYFNPKCSMHRSFPLASINK
jgi:hypothetical protein